MIQFNRLAVRRAHVAIGAVLLSGCAAKPPPPPPPVAVIPARPLPPAGAVASMVIPARDASGTRQTINANLTLAQTTWNLRSALNVAALNCLEPRHAPILPAYTAFLETHAKRLSATNRALDAEFRQKYGATYRGVRDGYMTQVYNYFALPPALPGFCDAALAVSGELAAVAPADLDTFAASALPRLEAVFESFFQAFEKYRIDVAAWDARYGPQYGITSAGYANPLAPGAETPIAPAGTASVPTPVQSPAATGSEASRPSGTRPP